MKKLFLVDFKVVLLGFFCMPSMAMQVPLPIKKQLLQEFRLRQEDELRDLASHGDVSARAKLVLILENKWKKYQELKLELKKTDYKKEFFKRKKTSSSDSDGSFDLASSSDSEGSFAALQERGQKRRKPDERAKVWQKSKKIDSMKYATHYQKRMRMNKLILLPRSDLYTDNKLAIRYTLTLKNWYEKLNNDLPNTPKETCRWASVILNCIMKSDASVWRYCLTLKQNEDVNLASSVEQAIRRWIDNNKGIFVSRMKVKNKKSLIERIEEVADVLSNLNSDPKQILKMAFETNNHTQARLAISLLESVNFMYDHQEEYAGDDEDDDEYGDVKVVRKTPLHIAVEKGDAALVELLLENGADRSLKDSDQLSPEDYARKSRNRELLDLICGYGMQDMSLGIPKESKPSIDPGAAGL